MLFLERFPDEGRVQIIQTQEMLTLKSEQVNGERRKHVKSRIQNKCRPISPFFFLSSSSRVSVNVLN